MGIFRIYYHPKSNIVLTNTNTKFVSTIVGLNTNPGPRELPYATLTKAISAMGTASSIVLSGPTIENISSYVDIIGDNVSADINGICNGSYTANLYNLRVLEVTGNYGEVKNCFVTRKGLGSYGQNSFNFVESSSRAASYSNGDSNTTFLNFDNWTDSTGMIQDSNIYVSMIDLFPRVALSCYPIFKYCLFRKTTVWKWNGEIIPDTDNINSIPELLSSLTNYATNTLSGTSQTYMRLLIDTSFYSDISIGQTNKIVDDSIYPIFNRYNVDGSISDYTLNVNGNNIALYMANPTLLDHQYVGCYKPNISGEFSSNPLVFGDINNVNSDGSDDLVTTPDLLISNGKVGFYASQDSIQTRNRTRSNVLSYARGMKPGGGQAQLKSGLIDRFYFGKNRTFTTSSVPCESVEIIPYDSLTQISSYPRYSTPFNDICQIWYHIDANVPVLFNELSELGVISDINLTEYGNWAVTNADNESFDLNFITGVTLRPQVIVYIKIELNLNYAE